MARVSIPETSPSKLDHLAGNIAHVKKAQGKLDEALVDYLSVLAIYERVYGTREHPEVAGHHACMLASSSCKTSPRQA